MGLSGRWFQGIKENTRLLKNALPTTPAEKTQDTAAHSQTTEEEECLVKPTPQTSGEQRWKKRLNLGPQKEETWWSAKLNGATWLCGCWGQHSSKSKTRKQHLLRHCFTGQTPQNIQLCYFAVRTLLQVKTVDLWSVTVCDSCHTSNHFSEQTQYASTGFCTYTAFDSITALNQSEVSKSKKLQLTCRICAPQNWSHYSFTLFCLSQGRLRCSMLPILCPHNLAVCGTG